MTFRNLKGTLHELLDQGKLEQIADMAPGQQRVLGGLVAHTFDPDPRIAWRAIEAMAQIGGSEAQAYIEMVALGHEVPEVRRLAQEKLEELARLKKR